MKRARRIARIVVALTLCAILLMGAAVLGINALMVSKTQKRVLTSDAEMPSDVDCILVLGCGVNGTNPSHMLEDRLLVGISLYERGVAPKLLMSGDHSRTDYNEVGVMKAFAMDRDVPSEDVFMDHAGLSTYESLLRARDVFGAKRIVIVSQEYHLYRALYLAERLGLEAYGVASDLRPYVMSWRWEAREMLARVKDAFCGRIQPEPTYPGDPIPISGDGDATNDADFERMVERRS